jgi:hypothetical protein
MTPEAKWIKFIWEKTWASHFSAKTVAPVMVPSGTDV